MGGGGGGGGMKISTNILSSLGGSPVHLYTSPIANQSLANLTQSIFFLSVLVIIFSKDNLLYINSVHNTIFYMNQAHGSGNVSCRQRRIPIYMYTYMYIPIQSHVHVY